MPMASASLKFSSSVLRTSALARSFSSLAISRPTSLATARARLVGSASAAEQFLVEVEIFLAGRILHPYRDRDLGGFNRASAQHREFLEHDLELGIGLHQLHHVG